MKRILLSAFACDPTKGSEQSNGWNWAINLAQKGFEIHCFTRIISKENIESVAKPDNIVFHYISLPFNLERLYHSSTFGMYLYYILWQWVTYKKAKAIHKVSSFSLAHHVTWGSTQLGSFLYKIDIPFIFGPAGGGQIAPAAFKRYFGRSWKTEIRREIISKTFLTYNPACKRMLQKAHCVLVSNPDTEKLAIESGAKRVVRSLDAALPASFFPNYEIEKIPIKGELKLLWVGRFLPRKGVLLLLEVMKELKSYSGITLTVVGDGEMKDAFVKQIKEYELTNSVKWVGKVSHSSVKEYYQAHDAFLFTSLRDSCPAQLIEAMAYSLPIITLDIHGQAVLVNEDNGIKCDCFTPNDTINQLTNAVLKLYNEPMLITNMGKAAYAFARHQTWDLKVDNIIKQYYPLL